MADNAAVWSAEKTGNAPLDAALRHVVDGLPDALLLLDEDWRILYANQTARRISHIQPENLNRETLWELYPKIVGTHLERAYREVVATRTERAVDAFYYEPFKTWFDVRIQPMDYGVAVHYRDVTARHLKEDELRASEQRYRVLAELNPQALWTADVEGHVLYANQRFLEYIGKDFVPEDGTEYLQCFFEEDRERVSLVWSHSVATGEDYVLDARLVRASDGAVRWWHLRALPVRDDTGAIQQWLGTAIDVHDTRMAAERLRQQYALVESSLDFIALYDMQGMPIFGNRAALQMAGFNSLADFARVAVKEFFFPADQEFIVNEFLPRVLREGHGEVEVRFRHFKTSEAIWMNYHVFLLRDVVGEPVAYGTVSRDVTAQKRAEAALIQTEKLAAVGRLASSIAHEINNPLESVMNLIYLARRNAVNPLTQQYLDSADEELRRVAIIANQTLRFHKQSTRAQAVSCADLYSTVLNLYEGKLKNSNITLEKRNRETKPVVCFDGEIRQVLNNLVSNAIDSMPRGGRLLVRSREATDWRTGRPGLVLTVADTGSGIDAPTQAKIFQAFFTTKEIGGTGLGLWVSAEITERHQGRIRVRSSQRKGHNGTVVTLFLPFQTTAAEPGRPTRS